MEDYADGEGNRRLGKTARTKSAIVRMEIREKVLKEAETWLKKWVKAKRQDEVEEAVRDFVLGKMVQSGQNFEDQSLSLESLKEEVADRAIEANIRLIRQEIERTADQILKQHTKKAHKKDLSQPCSFLCFAHIAHFTADLSAQVASILDAHFSPNHLLRSRFPLKALLHAYQVPLLLCYSRWKVEDLRTVETLLQNCIEEKQPWEEGMREVGVMELEQYLGLVYREHWAKVEETFANLSEYEWPLALKSRFKRELKEKYQKEGRIRQKERENCIISMVYSQILHLVHMNQEVTLFDEKLVPKAAQEVLFVAAKRENREELGSFIGNLAEILGLKPEFDMTEDTFRQKLIDLQRNTQADSHCFALLCVLLLLTGVAQQYLPQFQSQQREIPRFSAIHREFYRKLAVKMGNFRSSGQFLSLDPWLFGKSTEIALAQFLTEHTHPLVSTQPDQLLQEIDQYGGQIAFNSTPQGPLLRIFQWVKLLERPSLNTTIAVSGWQSELGDSAQDWKHLIDYPAQGNLVYLRWDAGTTASEMMGTIVEPGAALLGLISTKAAQWVRGNWSSFKDAEGRADRAGVLLATNIEREAFGKGPVSLIGFSLGTRAIQACLTHLKATRLYGRVQDVILMGGAVSSAPELWADLHTIVSGRVINLYSAQDWVLRYAYQCVQNDVPIGLQAISSPGIENFDVTSAVSGHLDHRAKLQKMLNFIEYRP